jgi:hypothetical protein
MYLDTCKVRSGNKVYTRVLLRESYREDGKVKHRTIANLSKCSDQEIAAIKLALQHKHDLAAFRENAQLNPNFTLRQGLSIGAVAVLEALARELGLVKALGTDREGKLALWQVIARVIDQGSRLSAVRLAQTHACCDLLKLDAFNEDDLYSNLAWLSEHQRRTETRLFELLHPGEKLFSTTSQAAIWRAATITSEPLAITVMPSLERCRLSLACCATKQGYPYQSKYLPAILPIPRRSLRK